MYALHATADGLLEGPTAVTCEKGGHPPWRSVNSPSELKCMTTSKPV